MKRSHDDRALAAQFPGANELIPRLREFNEDMNLLNDVLYRLIDGCLESRDPMELEALKSKDYAKVKDPSMLRFLVDLRGEEVDNTQMRDDLITLLIAGHETTAAVLTWLTYALTEYPEALATARAEIDEKARVLMKSSRLSPPPPRPPSPYRRHDCPQVGDGFPSVDDMKDMPEVQKLIAETLRMWPAPPLLIRCALEEDTWPEGGTGIDGGAKLSRANDLFISMYNMGRSPQLWENPDLFDPQRRGAIKPQSGRESGAIRP